MMTTHPLLCQIRAHRFVLIELNLYLDTHPCDTQALEKRSCCQQELARLIAQYEAECGPYVLTSADVQDSTCWAWLNGPWPWE